MGHWLEVRVGRDASLVLAGVLLAIGAIGLAVLRGSTAGLAEAMSDVRAIVGLLAAAALAVVLGFRLAGRRRRPLRATAGGAVAGVLACLAAGASVWWGAGPILAMTAFGLVALLLVATTPRVRAGGGGLGLVGGLADGGDAVCAERESERARAA